MQNWSSPAILFFCFFFLHTSLPTLVPLLFYLCSQIILLTSFFPYFHPGSSSPRSWFWYPNHSNSFWLWLDFLQRIASIFFFWNIPDRQNPQAVVRIQERSSIGTWGTEKKETSKQIGLRRDIVSLWGGLGTSDDQDETQDLMDCYSAEGKMIRNKKR